MMLFSDSQRCEVKATDQYANDAGDDDDDAGEEGREKEGSMTLRSGERRVVPGLVLSLANGIIGGERGTKGETEGGTGGFLIPRFAFLGRRRAKDPLKSHAFRS